MIEVKQVKVGVLVWWAADRYGGGWSCPAIVIEVVRGKSFRVMSLDNGKTTNPLRLLDIPGGDPTSRHEMRICTLDEVEEYIVKRRDELEAQVTAAKLEVATHERAIATYNKQIGAALAPFRKDPQPI